jgi:uncharacterized protein (DUF934 family)
MPKLIKLHGGNADLANDAFTVAVEDEAVPSSGGVILPLARFKAEGQALIDEGRSVGVLIAPDEAVEDIVDDLPHLALVAVAFPKYRDGRGYSSARLLRDRYGYDGEIRAVGDVLREQAAHMVRCGFDAFEPADGSTPQQWLEATRRYSHVYQRAADTRTPAHAERSR